jgi:hypothetical protein
VGDMAASPKREAQAMALMGLYSRCMPFINTVYTAQIKVVGVARWGGRLRL